MAVDKLIDSAKLDTCLHAEADAIRAKMHDSADIDFDFENGKGFADAIAEISGVRVYKGTFTPVSYNTGTFTVTHNLDLSGGYVVYTECDDWQAVIDAGMSGNLQVASINAFFAKDGKSKDNQSGYLRIFSPRLSIDYASNVAVTSNTFQVKPTMPFKQNYYIVSLEDLRG